MRRTFGKMTVLAVALIMVMSLIACNDSMSSAVQGTATLSLDVGVSGEEKAISITGSSIDPLQAYWTYTLKPVGSSGTVGVVNEETSIGQGETSVVATVSYGKWTAEVWGYRDPDMKELVYHGVATTPSEIGKSGGTLTVTASTMTTAGDAHAFRDASGAKSTSDLLLKPISTSQGTMPEGTTAVWKIKENGTERTLDTWTYTGGKWQTATSSVVPDSGVIYEVAPGDGNELSVRVADPAGNLIGHEGWVEASSKAIRMALNCSYEVSGSIEVRNGQFTITIHVEQVNFTTPAESLED